MLVPLTRTCEIGAWLRPRPSAFRRLCADRFAGTEVSRGMAVLFTIGHSTRALEEFIGLLEENGIRTLIDVRRFPASRRHPHFNSADLASSLGRAGIAYRHEVDAGGRRPVLPRSPNDAWRNAGFRGYADHMDTAEFRAALTRILDDARVAGTAVMCAEAVPWRCHRNLISDAAVALGFEVRHIMGAAQVQEHRLHAAARVRSDHTLEYASPETQLELGAGDGL
jgi:uncharacterized protein (DUF488 family)